MVAGLAVALVILCASGYWLRAVEGSEGLQAAGSLTVSVNVVNTSHHVNQREEERAAQSRSLQSVPFLPNRFISQFWGGGQEFSYTGRLSDWSWAGYRMGEQDIPNSPAAYNVVTDFGAVPDDGQSDWEAFSKAVNSIPKGSVLYIPPGQFIIDKPITIYKSIIIRGAGRDITTLYMPYSLNDIKPSSSNPSPWFNGPYFITFQGVTYIDSHTRLGWVKVDSKRGSTTVVINSLKDAKFSQGQSIRFVGSDKNGNLINYMYGNLTAADWPDHLSSTGIINRKDMFQFMSRIKSFKKGKGTDVVLELERPLPFDLKPTQWRDLAIYNDWRMTEAGVEDLTIQFAASVYNGHAKEAGYNALSFYGCQHSWARRMRIVNVDIGLHVAASAYFTVEDIIFSETIDRSGGFKNRWGGHHGLRFAQVSDCLARKVQFETTYVHDLTFDHTCVLNVWNDIRGPNLALDFHSTCSAANLVSRVNCGKCQRTWVAGGVVTAGGHAGMLNVFWGLTGESESVTIAPMGKGWGAQTTIVAAPFTFAPNYNDAVFEPINPAILLPYDLHTAMKSWRLLGLNLQAIDTAQKQLAVDNDKPKPE